MKYLQDTYHMYPPFCLKIHCLPLPCPTSSPPQNNYCTTLMLPRNILPCAPKTCTGSSQMHTDWGNQSKQDKRHSEWYYWKTQHSSAVSPDGHVQRNQSPAACIPPWLHSFPSSHCKLTPSAFCPPTSMSTSTRPSARSLPPSQPHLKHKHAPRHQNYTYSALKEYLKHFWTLNSHLKNVKMSWHMLEIFSELTFLK